MVAPLVFYGGAFLINNQMQKARNSRLMEEERQRRELIEGIDMLPPETMANMTPDQAAQFNQEFEFYKEAAMSKDKQLQQVGFAGLARISQQVSQTRESRIAAQRSFIVDESKELRNRTELVLAQRRAVQSPIDQAAELLSDPNFDPNSPVGRGRLSSLLENTSARQLLTDPTDALGSLISSGGVVGLIAAFLKGEEFKVSREEWRKMFEVIHEFENVQFENQLKQLGTRATELDQAGQELGVYPKGYSVLNQVLGPIRESEGMFENPFMTKRVAQDPTRLLQLSEEGIPSLLQRPGLPGDPEFEDQRQAAKTDELREKIQSMSDTELMRDYELVRKVTPESEALRDLHNEEIIRRQEAGTWNPERRSMMTPGGWEDRLKLLRGINYEEQREEMVSRGAQSATFDTYWNNTTSKLMEGGMSDLEAARAASRISELVSDRYIGVLGPDEAAAIAAGAEMPQLNTLLNDISRLSAAELLELLEEMEGGR